MVVEHNHFDLDPIAIENRTQRGADIRFFVARRDQHGTFLPNE
jgi:hypothetical protein